MSLKKFLYYELSHFDETISLTELIFESVSLVEHLQLSLKHRWGCKFF